MKDGFIKAAAGTPEIRVADCAFNSDKIISLMKETAQQGVKLLVLPELCITGYTCGDLFFQDTLQRAAIEALIKITKATKDYSILLVAGLPILHQNKLYNCAAVCYDGKILGMIPKTHLPNYGEFYELRQFAPGFQGIDTLFIGNMEIPFGTKQLFRIHQLPEFCLAVEICEDLWSICPPSVGHAAAGATVITNLSASNELIGKDEYRKSLILGQSGRLVCGYLYADAGDGESTTDLVYSGHNVIAENGTLLAESQKFTTGLTVTELDVKRIVFERCRLTVFPPANTAGYHTTWISMMLTETVLSRKINPYPFIPFEQNEKRAKMEDILSIQAHGLKKRIAHTKVKKAVLGISGGLDSALALLVTVRAMDLLNRPRSDIITVTMPCFGTTQRTLSNAQRLPQVLGAQLRTVDITKAVKQHFLDIGLEESKRDISYENAQARERTQVLMDIANMAGGMVIGTGNLSELALGWATYNGDHMSMYGVNSSVPKTLVRHLIAYEAEKTVQEELKQILTDIADTPVSPELLPSDNGEIQQVTEEILGPYALHDFYLFYCIRWGFEPSKILRLAEYAFQGLYEKDLLRKTLREFYQRFFAQQFKRSCLPDGPKIGSVALSPRGDWRMPSDAEAIRWLEQ